MNKEQLQLSKLSLIREKNSLMIHYYNDLDLNKIIADNTSAVKRLAKVRIAFENKIKKELPILSAGNFTNPGDLKNAIFSWMESDDYSSKQSPMEIIQSILNAEEKAITECRELLMEDLSRFENLRDVVSQHIIRINKALIKLKSVHINK